MLIAVGRDRLLLRQEPDGSLVLHADLSPWEEATHPGSVEGLHRAIIENAYSIPHVVGTCAMGPSPEEGAVVDALGRVHGVPGLAVVDASIMPEPPSAFPHIITIMIAEHLSKELAT